MALDPDKSSLEQEQYEKLLELIQKLYVERKKLKDLSEEDRDFVESMSDNFQFFLKVLRKVKNERIEIYDVASELVNEVMKTTQLSELQLSLQKKVNKVIDSTVNKSAELTDALRGIQRKGPQGLSDKMHKEFKKSKKSIDAFAKDLQQQLDKAPNELLRKLGIEGPQSVRVLEHAVGRLNDKKKTQLN